MNLIVLVFAVFVITLGLSVIIHPGLLKNWMGHFLEKKWLWPVSVLRLAIGILFINTAGSTSMPNLVIGVGTVLIAAGLIMPILGTRHIEALAEFWMAQKEYTLRIFGFIGLLLGIALSMAGLK